MEENSVKNILVSVIIPVFNGEKTIGACLNSVIGQTLKNIEIIVIDDCSTDNTWKLINEYRLKDNRILAIHYTKNSTASKARKDGVLKAKGQYIMFLDADDTLENNACEELYQIIEEKDVDILQFGTTIINNGATEGQIKWFQKFTTPYKGELNNSDILNYCFSQNKYGFNLWNKIYKASICKKAYNCIGDEPIPKAQDLYAYFMIAAFAKSYYGIDKSYYIYCYGGGVTGSKVNTVENFARHCSQANLIFKLIEFSRNNEITWYEDAIIGVINSLIDDNIGTLLKCKSAKVDFNVYEVFSQFYINGETTDYFTKECIIKPYDKTLHRVFIEYLLKIYKNTPLFIQKQILDLYIDVFENIYDINIQFDSLSKENLFYQVFKSALTYRKYKDLTIPVVFATNNNYAPYLGVTLQSLIDTCDSSYHYEIFIFFTELGKNYIYQFENFEKKNIHVRCVNVTSIIQSQQLYSRAHYSIEMYYRMVIAELLYIYPKVLYMDCDIIILNSIHQLFLTDIGDNILGAARNPIHKGMYNYLQKELSFDYKIYFNSGILIINTVLFTKGNIKTKCFDFISKHRTLACPDQDALNIVCKDKVYFFDLSWNFQWHHTVSINNAAIMTPLLDDEKEEYYKAEKERKIIHFTSDKKPWNQPSAKYSEIFWRFAKKTSFYEEIIYKNATEKIVKDQEKRFIVIEKFIAEQPPQKKEAESNTTEDQLLNNKHKTLFSKFFWEWKKNGFKVAIKKVKDRIFHKKELK